MIFKDTYQEKRIDKLIYMVWWSQKAWLSLFYDEIQKVDLCEDTNC